MLPILQDLMGEYEVSRIILLDPTSDDLREALSIKDPDQIMVGGYCPGECDSYWKKLVERSSLVTGFQQDRQTV
jgi:hypothetical protein